MLTQKLVLSYFSRLVVQFVQMITSFVVARIVGPNVLGILAYGLAYVNMYAFIADMGTGTSYIKLYSSGHDKESCIGTYFRIRLLLVFVFAVTVATSYFGKRTFAGGYHPLTTQDYVVGIYLIVNIIGLLYSAFTATWIARMEQAKTDIPQVLQSLLFQVFRLIVALLGYRAIAIATTNLIAVIVVAPVYFYLGRDLKIGHFDKALAKEIVRMSLPILLLILFQTLFYSTDKVLLKHFSNTEEVGYYSAAFAFASFIRTIESSAGLLFFPFFSRAIAENNLELINQSIHKFERFSFGFILPAVSIISIMTDKVIYLTYGRNYMPSMAIMRAMIPTFFIALAILPYGNILAGKGLFLLVALCWGISFVVFIVSAYLFVGMNLVIQKGLGIALALLFGTIVLACLYYINARRKSPGLKILPGKKVLLLSLGVTAILYPSYHYLVKDAGIIANMLFPMIYFVSYLLLGYVFRAIGKDEYALLLNVVNIKKLKKYIVGELKNRT